MHLKPRKLYRQIASYLDDPEIIVIHGPRQSGKTSLMHYIIEQNIRLKTEIFFLL